MTMNPLHHDLEMVKKAVGEAFDLMLESDAEMSHNSFPCRLRDDGFYLDVDPDCEWCCLHSYLDQARRILEKVWGGK